MLRRGEKRHQHEIAGGTRRAGVLPQVFRDSFFHADMHPGNIFVAMNTRKTRNISALIAGLLARKQRR